MDFITKLPVGSLLVLCGVVFLLVAALGGRLGFGPIKVERVDETSTRLVVAGLGVALLIVGLIYGRLDLPVTESTAVPPSPAPTTAVLAATDPPTLPPTPLPPTPTEPLPTVDVAASAAAAEAQAGLTATSAALRTLIALSWTPTSTVDASATVQAEINLINTQTRLDQTATASQWTATPSPTDPPTATPTPTFTPSPSATFAPAAVQEFDGIPFAYVAPGAFSADGTSANGAFWIMVNEVTNAQFVAVMNQLRGGRNLDSNGHAFADATDPDIRVRFQAERWSVVPGNDDYPMVEVTWYGAAQFCVEIGARLPTGAEWRKAATWNPLTQVVTLYPWGDTPPAPNQANFNSTVGGISRVGAYPDGRSPNGANDMGGNVAEWVNDGVGVNRDVYGGAWDSGASALRGDQHQRIAAQFSDADLGFRCVKDA